MQPTHIANDVPHHWLRWRYTHVCTYVCTYVTSIHTLTNCSVSIPHGINYTSGLGSRQVTSCCDLSLMFDLNATICGGTYMRLFNNGGRDDDSLHLMLSWDFPSCLVAIVELES